MTRPVCLPPRRPQRLAREQRATHGTQGLKKNTVWWQWWEVPDRSSDELWLVRMAACRRVQEAVARARSSGRIVALPPVVAEVEEVADLGKGDGQGGKRIKLVFAQSP